MIFLAQNEQSPLNEHKKMTTKYDVAHPGLGMGEAQKCDSVKLITGILLITGSPIYKR
jgi:hypothetical protein